MADKYRYKRVSGQKGDETIYASVAIGATGAPTLSTTIRNGFASITRSSAGVYAIVLTDTYNALLSYDVCNVGSTVNDFTFKVTASNPTAAGGATVTIQCLTATTATDPANGDTLLISFTYKNSSVNF